MTYKAWDDGPFFTGYGADEEQYHVRRFGLRCNGPEVLGDHYKWDPCHIHSDGDWRTKEHSAAQLRHMAAKEGWTFWTFDGKRADLCPACDGEVNRLLRIAEVAAS